VKKFTFVQVGLNTHPHKSSPLNQNFKKMEETPLQSVIRGPIIRQRKLVAEGLRFMSQGPTVAEREPHDDIRVPYNVSIVHY